MSADQTHNRRKFLAGAGLVCLGVYWYWAVDWRKSHHYGSDIVDITRRVPVDVHGEATLPLSGKHRVQAEQNDL